MDSSTSITVSKRINYWHKWEIPNFNTCILETLKSPQFIAKEYGKSEWYLELLAQEDPEKFIGYSLFLHVSETQIFKLNLQLGIIDSKNNFLHLYQNELTLEETNGTETFISQYQLYEQRQKYVPEGTLTIGCQITLIAPATSSIIGIDIPPCQLSNDFRQLLNDEATADVILTVGDRKFNAHKLILMARSSAFPVILQNSMQESGVKVIEIVDSMPETVGKVLQFIYTGKIDDLEENTADLLHAADKYDLKRLKAMCESSLYNQINIENAAEILVLADRCQAHQLKTLVRYFIKGHRREVRVTESFQETKRTRPDLILEMSELYDS